MGEYVFNYRKLPGYINQGGLLKVFAYRNN